MKHYCLTTIATVLILLSLTDSVFPDDIKTIDGNIIAGEIVGVDEEYISVKQMQNSMVFIQWRIVSLISRNKEVIVVSHENNRKKFSILTTTTGNLSAEDISFKTTDKIQDIYAEEIVANRPSFLHEREPSEQGVTHVPFSPSQLKPQNAPQQ